ncbi:MAG TPA: histidine kinase [Allosphingosinicella sp.]|nr:histidine kinase [Allosphingosinicella sp.]
MLRFLTGAGSATLLLLAGFFIWKGVASRAESPVPAAPAQTASAAADVPVTPGQPPAADARTREQRRFDRADRDNDGRVTVEEMTWQRRRNYQRLDANNDGQLSFEEWAAATLRKFAEADSNRDRALNRAEFATTAPRQRQTASARNARCDCNERRASSGGARTAAR